MITDIEMDYVERMVTAYRHKLIELIEQSATDHEPIHVQFEQIGRVCADYYGLKYEQLINKKTRKDEYVSARRFWFWFAKKKFNTRMTLSVIGRLAGGYDHSAVYHQVNKFNRNYEYDQIFVEDSNGLAERLGYKIVKVEKEDYTIEQIDLQL